MIDLVEEGFDLAVSLVSGALSGCPAPGAHGMAPSIWKYPAPQARLTSLAITVRYLSNIPAPDEWHFEDPAGNYSRGHRQPDQHILKNLHAAAVAGVGLC